MDSGWKAPSSLPFLSFLFPFFPYPVQLKMGNVNSFPKVILGAALEIWIVSWILFRNKTQSPTTMIKWKVPSARSQWGWDSDPLCHSLTTWSCEVTWLLGLSVFCQREFGLLSGALRGPFQLWILLWVFQVHRPTLITVPLVSVSSSCLAVLLNSPKRELALSEEELL